MREMAMPILGPAISRLSFLHKPPLCICVEFFKKSRFFERPTHFHSHPLPTTCFWGRFYCLNSHLKNKDPTNPDDKLIVLGIETSCDDTAAAIVSSDGDILSQVVSSQADLLVRYGGVAPKMAEEAHMQVIDQVVQETLDRAKLTEKDLSAVAVTIGPGLSLCLRVGVQKARKIAGCFNLPMVGVHHMEAHALVARLVEKQLQFPFITLLVSGERIHAISWITSSFS